MRIHQAAFQVRCGQCESRYGFATQLGEMFEGHWVPFVRRTRGPGTPGRRNRRANDVNEVGRTTGPVQAHCYRCGYAPRTTVEKLHRLVEEARTRGQQNCLL